MELLKNSITIFLALLAGFLALYQMKANLISSARIRWIEELKKSLSEYYSAVMDVISDATTYNYTIDFKKRKKNA